MSFDPGTVPVNEGGTGAANLANHGVVIGNGAAAVKVAVPGAAGLPLTSNGPDADPSFKANVDAQTAVAGAASSAKQHVVVTSEALSSATTYSLTLTDALIAATSVLQVTALNGVGTGVRVTGITPAPGSAVIALAFASYTGALTINVSIFN